MALPTFIRGNRRQWLVNIRSIFYAALITSVCGLTATAFAEVSAEHKRAALEMNLLKQPDGSFGTNRVRLWRKDIIAVVVIEQHSLPTESQRQALTTTLDEISSLTGISHDFILKGDANLFFFLSDDPFSDFTETYGPIFERFFRSQLQAEDIGLNEFMQKIKSPSGCYAGNLLGPDELWAGLMIVDQDMDDQTFNLCIARSMLFLMGLTNYGFASPNSVLGNNNLSTITDDDRAYLKALYGSGLESGMSRLKAFSVLGIKP